MMPRFIPINVDRNVSTADYRQLTADPGEPKVLVTKIFYTFQGEGPYAGRPAIFIRLAGCNIGGKADCEWCDTNFAFDEGVVMGYNDIMEKIVEYRDRCNLVVITGGEPLLQWPAMIALIKQIGDSWGSLVWQFETNGLLLREHMTRDLIDNNVAMVISPKVPHNRPDYLPLPIWLEECHALKYVVEANPFSQYHSVPFDALQYAATRGIQLFVSGMTVYKRAPNGPTGEVPSVWDPTLVDQMATASNYAHAARLAMELGLRVSYQTHLFGGVE